MRQLLLVFLLTLAALAQPVLQELPPAESAKWQDSLNKAAFPDHEQCVSLSHFVRLLRVNGRLHGLALHQANLHSGLCTWMHYIWEGSYWKKVGPGLPESNEHLVMPEPNAEEIQSHFQELVRGLHLQHWTKSAQRKLLEADKIKEL